MVRGIWNQNVLMLNLWLNYSLIFVANTRHSSPCSGGEIFALGFKNQSNFTPLTQDVLEYDHLRGLFFPPVIHDLLRTN